MTATVVFARSPSRRYMARPFHMLIDGHGVAMVWRGRAVEVEVRPGIHDAVAEMDDYTSLPLRFTAREGETVRISCEPNTKARFVSPWWSLVSRRLETKHRRLADPTGLGVVVLVLVEPTDL
jgi:hypothetical protein